MEYFVDNFYEFSDIRQSKYSSFMMMYELYKAHEMCKVCLQLNVLDHVTVVGLKCQSCRDKELVDITSVSKQLPSVEVLMNNIEVNDDTNDDQSMLENDTKNNILDQTTHDENNNFHSINMADLVSFSPIVVIEKLDQEFITSFLRRDDQSDQKKRKKPSFDSMVIKKKNNSRIGNKLLKPINYVFD